MSDQLPAGYADTDIAIVGFAGRFPGATDAEQFWRNIRDGVASTTWLDDEALRAAGVSDELLADPNYVRAAYPVDDMEGFDAGFFGFNPREAAIIDPQQRHFLEVAWTALEHAGYAPAAVGKSVGVFAGCGASLYLMFNLLSNPKLVEDVGFFLLRHTGNDKDFLATRVSYLLNLQGPSVNVQTACSTSLVAIHLAVQSLLANECDYALAGGSTLRQPHRVGYVYKEGEIVSPDGVCRTFDARAAGTIFGSGTGAVVLRRLVDALADGDTIHAVIKGSAINNDGSEKVGYLAPSVDGQAKVIAEALALANVEASSIQYVECHGTATPVGDPIEVAALSQAFADAADRKGTVALGSVKTNVGHLDTAAGVAGVIKMVQALRHRQLPASLHYESPNPAIDFESGPFYVNTALRDWTTDGTPRRAGVSSLGAGGTNAHVVLQEAPAMPPSGPARPWQLYPVSAKTQAALGTQAANVARALRDGVAPAADMAFTLQDGRQAFAHRRFVVAASPADAAALLEAGDAKTSPSGQAPDLRRSLAFMFAGGGAQHPDMGRQLYEAEPAYRAAVDRCIGILQPKLDWDLKALLYPAAGGRDAAAVEMERPSRSLPCLFITQYAMAQLLESWGLVPDAMIGHSMGEYTAAHLAGVFSLEDALALVTLRGKLFETVPPGGMLSVPLSADDLGARLPDGLSIAAANAPGLSVASGPTQLLEALERTLAADDIECTRVRINIAAHSSMLEGILQPFGEFFRGIRLSAPTRRFVSNVSGTWITDAEATDPQYWVRHLRQTVRFADGVGVLLQDEGRLLLEVGPGRTLATLAGLHASRTPSQVTLTSMRHPDEATDDVAAALAAVGRLWLAGYPVPWRALHGEARRQRVPMPTYPFEHQPYYIAPGKPSAPAPTLARRSDVGQWFWRPAWRRAALPAHAPALTATRWLVFRDTEGVGADLARRLADRAPVVSVVPGAVFARLDVGTFTIDPAQPEHFHALLEALAADGALPDRVVHAWGAVAGALAPARGFDALLHLARAIGERGDESPMRLDVVTAGGQCVGGESVIEPDRALVLGPVRVLPKEFPHLRTRAIDLPGIGTPGFLEERAVSQLVRELAHEGDDAVVAWRGAERFVQDFDEAPLPALAADEPVVRDGEVVLITGGLGGLGALVAADFARQARVKLVLVGRRAERTPAVEAIERMGAEVMLAAADVTDEAAMRRVVDAARARFGGIHTVIHAAGVVEDALVLMKEPASAARVLAPKVQGTLALDAATRGEPIERVVLFSSRGAYAGVAGQVDYTSASAFLDAWAQRRSALDGLPVLSIDWSAWQGVGLAAAAGAGGAGAPAGRATAHPLLERCVREEGDTIEYRSTLSTTTHWLLDGHRIAGGEALIPGTGYLEIARAAAMERGGETIALRDVFFLSPFAVHGTDRRELRVVVSGSGDERDVVIEGRPAAGGAWEEHARAVAAPVTGAAGTIDVPAIAARCTTRTVTFDGGEQRNSNLVLGRRWNNVERIAYGQGEALATLTLPAEFRAETADFALHPALLDVATACAQALVPGFDPMRDFFIPVSYGSVTMYAPLEAACVSHIRLQPGAGPDADTATYDVTIAAPDGRVLVDIADFTMMRVKDRGVVGRPSSAPAAKGLLQFEGAMTPEEGLDALRRLLAVRVSGNVIVSPQHLPAYLSALAAPPEPQAAPAAVAAAPACEVVDAGEVEAVLAAHESVHQAVVTAHREKDGSVRATAFVVWELGEQASIAELRRFLKGKVPEDLVPQHLVELEALPVDASGAVDRAALPDPFAPVDDYVAPSTEMERVVAGIWQELLGVARVSVHDNFLDVGGHSLLAMRAVSRISKATGVRLNPSVMTLNTLGQIAAECEAKAGATR
jgi:acyl transferase domain-containing protein